VHALESLSSNNASLPSNFKLKENLEKQVTVIGTYSLVAARLFGVVVEVLAPFADYIYYSSFAWFYLTK
jgi:hypothetical protein